ncbi:MAG: acyltransferase [Ilumatobacter sp.]|nr:acyltransferase [Ilumatobacter sp.]
MPGLDGLRGLAVTAVIVYHFEPSWLPGGFIGVDVFFVLSGFLITSLLLREQLATGTVDAVRFFVRRLRRLLPALLLLLTALAVYASTWADPVELERLRRHGFGAVAYVSNWIFIGDRTTYTDIVVGTSPLRHVWSLAIEEQLYLVLTLGIIGIAAMGPSAGLRKRFGIVTSLLAVASAVWMAWLSAGGAPTERTYFGTDTRAQAMLVGAVIGATLFGQPAEDRPIVRYGGWIGLGVLCTVLLFGTEDATWLHQGGFFVVALAAGAVVIGCASSKKMRIAFSFRPLVLIGLLSYGLYLWHWPVLVIFDRNRTGLDGFTLTILRLALSVVAAAASYALVERPIRSGALGRRWKGAAAVTAILSFSIVAFVFTWATATPSAENVVIEAESRRIEYSPSTLSATTDPTSEVSEERDDVHVATSEVTTAVRGPVSVAVLGDSVLHTIIGGEVNATGLQFTEWTPAQTTFDPQEIEVTSIAKPACSFLPGEIAVLDANGSYSHASLESFCKDWRSELSIALPSVDVLAVHLTNDLDDRWINGRLFEFGTAAYFELLGSFLDEVYRVASPADVEVLLVASAPRLEPTWVDAVGYRESMVSAFYQQWAADRSDVSTVDMVSLVCPAGECPGKIDGVEWRWDGRHYTRSGALGVVDWLTPILVNTASQGPETEERRLAATPRTIEAQS